MSSFDEVWAQAVARHGEAEMTRRASQRPRTAAELRAVGDDRYLSAMAKHLFAAGFRWKVVQLKWPDFEEAFDHFDPATVAAYGAERVDALKVDTRVIRNAPKIVSTVHNARFVVQTAEAHGRFAHWIAAWPDDDIVGLWDALKAGGDRLGGMTGPRFLRSMGKDTFLLTDDVATALTELGLITGSPTSKGARRAAQEAFNRWKAETGRPLCALSTVVASSTGPIYEM